MVRRLERGEQSRPPGTDPINLPAGFPRRLPDPLPGSRVVGATADASEEPGSTTVVYTARLESAARLDQVRSHYLDGLRAGGFEVTELPAGSDRFDVDVALRYASPGCSGEVLASGAGAHTDVTLVARVQRQTR